MASLGVRTAAAPTGTAKFACAGRSVITELEDEGDVEFADLLWPEETVEKVKTDDLLLDGIDVRLENEVGVTCDGSTLAVQI